jgi:dTDP-glucose pyrophosphorylase
MNFVIPMAGLGSRFTEAGYTLPKPLLPAHGKTLLEWSVDSLPLELATKLIFVGLEAHRDQYDLETIIRKLYASHHPEFLWLKSTTRGQAETVVLAAPLLDQSVGLLIFNIDTAFRSDGMAAALRDRSHDGVLGSFYSNEPRFSFAKSNEQGTVIEVREKVVISDQALTGLYHFASTELFLEIARAAISADEREKGEFYVAPLYNKLIARGARFITQSCEQHWILGTPAEYESFLALDPASL